RGLRPMLRVLGNAELSARKTEHLNGISRIEVQQEVRTQRSLAVWGVQLVVAAHQLDGWFDAEPGHGAHSKTEPNASQSWGRRSFVVQRHGLSHVQRQGVASAQWSRRGLGQRLWSEFGSRIGRAGFLRFITAPVARGTDVFARSTRARSQAERQQRQT